MARSVSSASRAVLSVRTTPSLSPSSSLSNAVSSFHMGSLLLAFRTARPNSLFRTGHTSHRAAEAEEAPPVPIAPPPLAGSRSGIPQSTQATSSLSVPYPSKRRSVSTRAPMERRADRSRAVSYASSASAVRSFVVSPLASSATAAPPCSRTLFRGEIAAAEGTVAEARTLILIAMYRITSVGSMSSPWRRGVSPESCVSKVSSLWA
mmetsp:Transcript_39752/g.119503  ORF Transcript_39752/g.119503 Transcript_39752/m.119503 type:complete len:207 (+) Transcript_39752:840-1460(+)